MARAETLVQLTTELRQLLDEAADSRRIVDRYRLRPPGDPEEWGDMDALADASARDVLQRLDAEERADGLPPW